MGTRIACRWADTIKIGRVRERVLQLGGSSCAGAAGGAPLGGVGAGSTASVATYMEIIALIQTDFYICGLAGVTIRYELGRGLQSDLLVLAYVCEPADEDKYGPGGAAPASAQRPELRLISRQNDEFLTDALSVEGFGDLRCGSYGLALPPRTAAWHSFLVADETAQGFGGVAEEVGSGGGGGGGGGGVGGGGGGGGSGGGGGGTGGEPSRFGIDGDESLLPETTAYIVSPRDIIVARSRDWDDRVGWLLERGKVEAALSVATRHEAELKAHKVLEIDGH
jgi:hypothetical protein